MENNLKIFRLDAGQRIGAFDCGDEDLNEFILKEAHLYSEELLAVSYAVVNRDTDKVIAYFSLANDRISLSDFETKTDFNRFRRRRFVNEKRLKSYPAAKICRLGVDVSAKGLHVGSQLLDFIKSYFTVNNKTGCRFLTVDAYAAAIPFYEKNDFVPLNNDAADAVTRLLYFDLKSFDDETQ